MKKTITLIIGMFLAVGVLSAQQISEKTLIKPINLRGSDQVAVDFRGKVNVKTWSNERAKVEIGIKAYGLTSQALKYVVAGGRYNVSVEYKDATVFLTSPGLNKDMEIGGKDLKDEVDFFLYVPEMTKVKILGQDSDGEL